jgi:hypothetical protein
MTIRTDKPDINDGGPAFPITRRKNERYMDEMGYDRTRAVEGLEGGMTLRDYAAIKFAAAWVPVLGLTTMPETREQRAAEAVRLGLVQADAFLKARNS